VRTFVERWLALVASIAILAASVVITVNRTGGTQTYRLTAYFPRAIGLFPRSTVRVLGVEVGRVTAVVPDGDRVRVEMDVQKGTKIPADASAVIVPISLISDRYVQLAPVWRGGPVLHDGGVIPLDRGVAPAELDDLLRTLKSFLQALEPGSPGAPGALGRFFQNADKALAGQGPALGQTIDALTTLLDTLGRNVSSVDAIIVSLDQLFTELSQHDQEIVATNQGLSSVFGALASEQDALATGPANLAAMVSQLGQLIRAHRADLDRDLPTLLATTQALVRQKDRLLEQILWLPVLSKAATQAIDAPDHRILVRNNLVVPP
jgi:virulence factor Mce-like protein